MLPALIIYKTIKTVKSVTVYVLTAATREVSSVM